MTSIWGRPTSLTKTSCKWGQRNAYFFCTTPGLFIFIKKKLSASNCKCNLPLICVQASLTHWLIFVAIPCFADNLPALALTTRIIQRTVHPRVCVFFSYVVNHFSVLSKSLFKSIWKWLFYPHKHSLCKQWNDKTEAKVNLTSELSTFWNCLKILREKMESFHRHHRSLM